MKLEHPAKMSLGATRLRHHALEQSMILVSLSINAKNNPRARTELSSLLQTSDLKSLEA